MKSCLRLVLKSHNIALNVRKVALETNVAAGNPRISAHYGGVSFLDVSACFNHASVPLLGDSGRIFEIIFLTQFFSFIYLEDGRHQARIVGPIQAGPLLLLRNLSNFIIKKSLILCITLFDGVNVLELLGFSRGFNY